MDKHVPFFPDRPPPSGHCLVYPYFWMAHLTLPSVCLSVCERVCTLQCAPANVSLSRLLIRIKPTRSRTNHLVPPSPPPSPHKTLLVAWITTRWRSLADGNRIPDAGSGVNQTQYLPGSRRMASTWCLAIIRILYLGIHGNPQRYLHAPSNEQHQTATNH